MWHNKAGSMVFNCISSWHASLAPTPGCHLWISEAPLDPAQDSSHQQLSLWSHYRTELWWSLEESSLIILVFLKTNCIMGSMLGRTILVASDSYNFSWTTPKKKKMAHETTKSRGWLASGKKHHVGSNMILPSLALLSSVFNLRCHI